MDHPARRTPDERGTGARRRRPLLVSLTSLGVTLALVGLAGVFAVGSDRATTGENSAETGVLGGEQEIEVDLQLASATLVIDAGSPLGYAIECGEFVDDLTTGILQTSAEQLTDPVSNGIEPGLFCLRNAGTHAVDVRWSAFDVFDTELAPCAPGEAAAGDTDCDQPNGTGELAGALYLFYDVGCDDEELATSATLANLATGSSAFATLGPDETVAACVVPFWLSSSISQTDRVTYRLAFDGTSQGAPPPSGSCVDDAGEDDDDPGHARSYAGPVSGQICADDADVFEYVHAGGNLHATLVIGDGSPAFGDGDTDLDLVVYRLEGEEYWVEVSETYDPVEEIDVEAPPGTYIVEVYGWDGAEAPYTLTVESSGL